MLLQPIRKAEPPGRLLRQVTRLARATVGTGIDDARPLGPSQSSRGFTQRATGLQDAKYSRYFWPTRPDFLPSRGADDRQQNAQHASPSPEEENALVEPAQRLLPSPGCRIALPSESELPASNLPLQCGLVEELSRESLWPLFQAHLRKLEDKGSSVHPHLDKAVFDGLFWSIASQTTLGLKGLEIVFSHLRKLYDYAVNQAGYGLSRLQFNRLVYVWVTLWAQLDKANGSFEHADFLRIVERQFSSLQGRLASRVLARLTIHCDTPQKAEILLNFLKRYQDDDDFHESRIESWSSSSRSPAYDGSRYFTDHSLETVTLRAILKRCRSLSASDEVLQVILAVMNHAGDTLTPELVFECLFLFDYDSLLAFLPESVLQDMTSVEIEPDQVYQHVAELAQTAPIKVTRASQEELPPALLEICAAVLAEKGDYRLAFHHHHHKHRQPQDADSRDESSDEATLAYTIAIRTCADCAMRSDQQEWADRHLERAMHLFATSRWYDSFQRKRVISKLAFALDVCLKKEERILSVDREPVWTKRLRRFSTILLAYDPSLDTMHIEKHRFSPVILLLRMHLRLRDYPFAKRLYLVESMNEDRSVLSGPVLSRSAFLWFFQASITQETDVEFATQLFVYWTSLEESAEGESYLPHMPPSLLHMYFGRLFASGKKRSIDELQRYISFDRSTRQRQLTARTHAMRMVRVCFHAGEKYIDSALSLSYSIIKEWQAKSPDEVETLLNLYQISLEKSTVGPTTTPKPLQRQILRVFASFRKLCANWSQDEVDDFFLRSSSSSSLPSSSAEKEGTLQGREERKRCIYTIYRSALETVVKQSKDARSLKSMESVEEWVFEMQSKWGLMIGPEIWNLRIESGLAVPDSREGLQHAREMFERGIRDIEKGREEQGGGGREDRINHQGSGVNILSSITVGRLMMCLVDLAEYNEALQVYYQYKAHALEASIANQVMVEAARIALLHGQGNEQEAENRVHELSMETRIEEDYRKNSHWARTLRAYSRSLKEQQAAKEKAKEEEQRWRWRRRQQGEGEGEGEGGEEAVDGAYEDDVLSEEEKQRAKAFKAMASGQPWKWKKEE